MNKSYFGIIVEESLDDNRLLNQLDVKKLYITGHEEPAERWHMYEVKVTKEEIEDLSKHIIEDWYMHFWRGNNVIAIFKGKIFKFDYNDKNTWTDVLEYGRLLG